VLAEAEGGRQITLLATGSEVSIAPRRPRAIAKEGIGAAVVSMPLLAFCSRNRTKNTVRKSSAPPHASLSKPALCKAGNATSARPAVSSA